MIMDKATIDTALKTMGRTPEAIEVIEEIASESFFKRDGYTSRPDIDMAYHLGWTEALQHLAQLMKKHAED